MKLHKCNKHNIYPYLHTPRLPLGVRYSILQQIQFEQENPPYFRCQECELEEKLEDEAEQNQLAAEEWNRKISFLKDAKD